MTITERQLETWSHQGATVTSSETYRSIKESLEFPYNSFADQNFETYLQGSYGNDTNIYRESDVDIVIQLNSIFKSNIASRPQSEQIAFSRVFPDSNYQFSTFKEQVLDTLQTDFDHHSVTVGNKSIKLSPPSVRRNADVIPCYQYRYYEYFDQNDPDRFFEGIIFPSKTEGDIINYPKLHRANMTQRNQESNGRLKPMVRVLKNFREYLIDNNQLESNAAPSYFLECLWYNVPPSCYGHSSYSAGLLDGIHWVLDTIDANGTDAFWCAHRIHPLFGETPSQWKYSSFISFISALVHSVQFSK